MPISPRIAQGIQALRAAAVDYGPGTEVVKAPSASPELERLKDGVGDAGLERMFARGQWVKSVMSRQPDEANLHPEAVKPETLISVRSKQGRFAKPKVERHVMTNGYEPGPNKISLVDPSRLHYAAHELRHAHDHLSGALDLHDPAQRLAAEENAFGTQIQAARELGVDPGIEGRSAAAQARTYTGKPGYPGTLEESREAVRRHQGG